MADEDPPNINFDFKARASKASNFMNKAPVSTPKCTVCGKSVYFAEKVMGMGKPFHRFCMRCNKCQKVLTAGQYSEHEGKMYCTMPCYNYLFGPKGKYHRTTKLIKFMITEIPPIRKHRFPTGRTFKTIQISYR